MKQTKTTIPKITQEFMEYIETKAKEGTYRINIDDIVLDIYPYVFPPQSPHSESSKAVYNILNHVKDKKILDIGTGPATLAIYAAKKGAYVDAVDIDKNAVNCAKHNVIINNLSDKVSVYYSDMFSNIKKNPYDLIIANLPILDADDVDNKYLSLFDKGYTSHRKLFEQAKDYLTEDGKIIMCHADLESRNAFNELEKMASEYNWKHNVIAFENSLGHEWRTYEFQKKR